MRFYPREARDDINVSKEHPLVEAGTLFVGIGLIFALLMILLFVLVDVVLYLVPEEKEIAMFSSWLPEDLVTVAYDDPRLEKLEQIVFRLSRHWPETKYDFNVEINDSTQLNAMAFPGGLIVVTSGLLDKVESENELAFIIGHEMGHFKNRDHIRALGRGVTLGILFSAISSNESSVTLGASIADLTLRGFSRRQESAADDFGLGIVHQEYGHVAEAWRFFERFEGGDEGLVDLVTYLSTHPSPKNRIEELIENAGRNGWSIQGDVVPLDW